MSECRVSVAANTTARGKVLFPDGGDVGVNAFLGVPYAQSPVGELRFCPPQHQPLWTGEKNCTQFGPMSMQPLSIAKLFHPMFDYPENMSEDCLFLNIFSPNLSRDAHLPVMVWFHGGGFAVGTSDLYNGTALSGFNNVIVVTVNYRLGPFGFFTTGDDVIPGNNGLLDQVEALRWVQIHIAAFGGDPDNVTIFGESAGAVSCSLHVVSELTRGLFRRAIIQSGPATSSFLPAKREMVRSRLQPHLEDIGYKGNTSDDLLQFLRSAPAEALLQMVDKYSQSFTAVIDGYYLKDYPHNLYNEGRFQDVEIMAGCCTHEGYSAVRFNPPQFTPSEAEIRKYLEKPVGAYFTENTDAILEAIYEQFFTSEAIDNLNIFREQLVEMMGDLLFTAPTFSIANRHAAKAPVYMYIYAHRASFVENDDTWVVAEHGDDVYPVFGMGFMPRSEGLLQSEADKSLNKMLMSYWTNFAKTGNPNGKSVPQWSPFSQNSGDYIVLKTSPEMTADYKPQTMQFWEKDIPRLDTSRIYKFLFEDK